MFCLKTKILDSFVYLMGFCAIFHRYMSDEGSSSRYWNDNSSFPQSRGGMGAVADNSPPAPPHGPSPQPLPSLSQHTDAGVPVMFSRCLSSVTDKNLRLLRRPPPHLPPSLPITLTLCLSLLLLSLLTASVSVSCTHTHTLTPSLLQLTVLLKRHFLGPADFLDIIL